MKRVLLLAIFVLLMLGVGLGASLILAPRAVEQAWTGLGLPRQGLDQLAALLPGDLAGGLLAEQPEASGLEIFAASGFLEAEETAIVAEISGQVRAVLAAEGQAVTAGQPLLRLDDSVLMAQMQQAEQAVVTAQARRELAEAGPRPAELEAAQAGLQAAQVVLDGARQALVDAQAARADPQELIARINAVQGQIALARRQIEVQQARQAVIRVLQESIAGDGSDQGQTQRAIYDRQEVAATATIAAAQAELQGAQRVLAQLQQMRQSPLSADVQVRAAESQVRLAEQAVAVAAAERALAAAPPQPEAIRLAEAQLAAAVAAKDVLAAQRSRYTLLSPCDGVVTLRAIEPGETASAATPLLQVADLGQITLTVYVPVDRIGRIAVGQPAQVRVDAYPQRRFDGAVTAISSQAEFTPKNILASEERSAAVFAVEITLAGDNSDGALKPGMPADVKIELR